MKHDWAKSFFILFLSVFSIGGYANTAMLVESNGKLIGADHVVLDGYIYSVRFIDDSFDNAFGSKSNLDFTTQSAAQAASRALDTQVFNNNIYDSNPFLTSGCSALSADPISCAVVTPYAVQNALQQREVLAQAFENYIDNSFEDEVTERFPVQNDLEPDPSFVYADWIKIAAVPAPASALLMASGLFALGGVRRKKRT